MQRLSNPGVSRAPSLYPSPPRALPIALAALTVSALLTAGCHVGSATPGPTTLPASHAVLADPTADADSADVPDSIAARRARILADGPLRGMTLGLFSQDPRYAYDDLLVEIRDVGFPWVSLFCNFYQSTATSTDIGVADPRTAPWDRIRLTVRAARALGLRVMLFPVVFIQNPGEDDWRGTIAPRDRSEWHRRYRALLLDAARLAAQEGVEILSIGSEFNSMQRDTDAWLHHIDAVREIYSGALTYSVNWDTLNEPEFFHLLELIGMTTYFSLADGNDPTVEMLERAWQPIRADIIEWQRFHGLPIVFTEVGFPSLDGASTNPWNYLISETVDLEEQADCYEAFTRVWKDEGSISGVFFYNWFGRGGSEDGGYTPRGKPALEVLRRWFPTPAGTAPGDDR